MNLEVAALCDAATDSGGKLNILGAFDCIWAPQIPTVHPHCAVALRMRFSRVEEGSHRIRIHVIDEDGHNVMPALDAELMIQFRAEEDTAVANIILNIQQLKLERLGEYAVEIAVDGRQSASLPLWVRRLGLPEVAR